MHRWYVKSRQQQDHNERASVLECEVVLEDTSSQVDASHELPHVIIQVGRLGEDGEYNNANLVFVEPVEKSELDSVLGDDDVPEVLILS